MVATLSTTAPNSKASSRGSSPAPAKPKRAPLLPSESDNNGYPLPRRLEISRDVTMTSSSSSSLSSSSSTTTTLSLNSVCTPRRRSPSTNHVTPPSPVERRHSVDNPRTGEMSSATLTKKSARSLSVSFQGESFALPVSKVTKPAPERRKTVAPPPPPPPKTSENPKPVDKQRWPGRSRHRSLTTMSVDFTNEKMKFSGSGTFEASRKSMSAICDSDNSDHAISDIDNISSGSTRRRAIVVPARFWQETINLLRRVQPDGGRKVVKGGIPASRRAVPLLPAQNAVGSKDNLGNGPSIFGFSVDSRRGKVGEKKLVDAHVLRLMHNKHLQWRFANAKVDAAMLVQRATAKKSLYNAWVTISKIWHSVVSKRVEMQQLNQNLKLHSILNKHMSYLDNWDLTDRDHSISLAGAIGALESSSLCLPVLCGAKADIQNLKEAICSAFDVMQAIANSICSLVTKVENVNLMASELASATKTECFLLDQCKDLFTTLTLMEVQDCSLRTHTLQLTPTTRL